MSHQSRPLGLKDETVAGAAAAGGSAGGGPHSGRADERTLRLRVRGARFVSAIPDRIVGVGDEIICSFKTQT